MNLALWSAKTGLDAQNTQMAIIANNLANANTTGYKSQRAAFQDLMYQNVRQVGAQSTQNTQYSTGLTLGTGVRIVATEANYAQGSSTTTNGPLDLQISGQGFFQITMPDGSLAYTRDGSFTLDNQGNVVTASGYPLQPAITIPVGTQSVTVGNDGAVTAVSAAGKTTQIGQVQLADFHQRAGSAEHRQQPGHRVRRERLAADRHGRGQRPRHHPAGLARRPRTSTRSPSSST